VIVGASAAGLRCASRLARLEPETEVTVVELRRRFSVAACGLPYVLSGDLDDVDSLRRTVDGTLRDEAYFREVKGVTVLAGWRATAIDAIEHRLAVERDGEQKSLEWDELVLATGAHARRLPGQPQDPRVVCFHEASDLAPLHRGLVTGTLGHAAIVGAGLVGCELCEAFRSLWGAEVTLVEAAAAPLPGLLDEEFGKAVSSALAERGVRVLSGRKVERLNAGEHGVEIELADRAVTADIAIIAIGVDPTVELALTAGVGLGPHGAIAVDDRLRTSVPHVWAAGDCVESISAVTGKPVYLPLGSLANREGRTLANILAGIEDRFPPVAGAFAVKVFDWNVAAVGITRRAALALGRKARSVWVTGHDRANYWPEAREIHLHLVYEEGSGAVLGVQAIGTGEVAKRIDVATQWIVRGATIADLGHIEHAYAPPYAPAVDPLAVAAWAARNQEEGVCAESPDADFGGRPLLDVRNPDESEERPVPGGEPLLLPLDRLRGEAPAERPDWLVICERGGRSAEAVRRLRERGGNPSFLGGGLRLRRIVTPGDGA
jgi:NADPH-dependent 2,4-dienoyl-CoA reductase/sulfur reductase-like enzyme/rhodanese-related sulfurtransferase